MHKDVPVAALCRCAKSRYQIVLQKLITSRTKRIVMSLRRCAIPTEVKKQFFCCCFFFECFFVFVLPCFV